MSPLETRIFILLTFLSTLMLFGFSVLNLIYKMPFPLVAMNILSTISCFLFYMLSRTFKNHDKLKPPFAILSLIFIIVAWFTNAGINGLMMSLILIFFVGIYSITSPKYRLFTFAVLLVLISSLVAGNYYFNDLVVQYKNEVQRFQSYFFGGIIFSLFIYFLIDLIIKNYEAEYDNTGKINKLLQSLNTELSEITKFHKAILDNAAYAIISSDADGNIRTFNPAAEKLLGYRAEEIIGQKPSIFHVKEEIESRAKLFSENLGIKVEPGFETFVINAVYNKPNEFEWTFIHKDGSRFPVQLNISALYGENNNITGFLGIANDISKRKHAEKELMQKTKELEESEEKYRNLFKRSHDANLIIDNNVFVDFNDAAMKLLRYSSKEKLKNTHPSKLSPPFQPDGRSSYEKAEEMMAIAKTKGSHRFEWVHRKSDGEDFYAEVSLTIIPFQGRNLIHTAWRDISDRKMMLDELIHTKEKAEKANQLKSEFLAQMSHEIRSPINSILNFTSLVEDLTINNDNEELKDCFSSIDSASKRVIRTIDSILNMSELQLGTYQISFRDVSLRTILEGLVNEYRKIAKSKNLDLNLEIVPGDLFIVSDEYAVGQIFANLIDNSIKYTDEGEINIEVKSTDENKYFVYIKDTGKGISEEYLPYLFEPFSQEEQGYTRRFDGNGLGMSLVKKYCEIIKAEIDVESQAGKGTKFSISFNKNGIHSE